MCDSEEIKERLRSLEREFNSMQCPDCGGLHQCRLRFTGGDIVVSFRRESLGLLCWGYTSFVNQSVRDLKAQYNIPLEP